MTDTIEPIGARRITLGGANWDVPPMRVKEICKLLPAFNRFAQVDAKAMSEAQVEDFFEIGFTVLRRVKPDLKHEEFLEMPVTFAELASALPAIAELMGVTTENPAE